MLDNLANIDLLQRQQRVLWPEFSWETKPGDPESRCFQMFAPDISRAGYTNTGRVYSIICPQQGACSSVLGCLNVEVTVTGQRGWVDEPNGTLAADMKVEGKIWFSPSAKGFSLVQGMSALAEFTGLPFPADKAHAIKVTTHELGVPDQPIFPVRTGESERFASPEFARHAKDAWSVAHLEVQIGDIMPTGDARVDGFNQLVMRVFNVASGNMLQPGNVLTWNVWFATPELVDQQEWRKHAELWRESIDADYGSPDGPGTKMKRFNGSLFDPIDSAIMDEIGEIFSYLRNLF
jgi:hypothetical protein